MLRRVKKAANAVKQVRSCMNNEYLRAREQPLNEKAVLLEGGQGANLNGNMFAMLRELCVNPRWSSYEPIFVVTAETRESAKQRMAFYGFDRVRLCVRGSKAYSRALATSKYLMTDNSLMPFFNKREGQVFVNTWHGTPLKTLGKSDKSNLASLANIQKNYLMCDYALFPNAFTRDVFLDDYDLRPIFRGKYVIANYPRNYVFYDKEQGVRMKEKLGFGDKRVFAYMPTWRGTGRKASTDKQLKETQQILEEFDEKLDDGSLLLVNLHFLLSSQIDCSGFRHIAAFPAEYDTYEVLNACDGLVTDYSSVFFDFAVTGKKIILYAYDKEKYLNDRGTYLPFDELPFPITETVDGVIAEMKIPAAPDEEFLNRYCPNGSERSCEKLFELMTEGQTDLFEAQTVPEAGENICLLYAGQLPPKYYDAIIDYINDHPEYRFVVAYRRNLTARRREFLQSLPAGTATFGILSAYLFRLKEILTILLFTALHISRKAAPIGRFARREAARLFYSFRPMCVVDFTGTNIFMGLILSKLTGKKLRILHGDHLGFKKRELARIKFVGALEDKRGFVTEDCSRSEIDRYLERRTNAVMADPSVAQSTTFGNGFPIFYNRKGRLICFSFFCVRTPYPIRLSDAAVSVGLYRYKARFFLTSTKRFSKTHAGFYKIKIPLTDVIDLPANNPVCFSYTTKYQKLVNRHIVYLSLLGRHCIGLHGPLCEHAESGTVAAYRQSRSNRMNLYVRSLNVTDRKKEGVKIFIAFCLSLIWHPSAKKRPILLYEKNSSKYEESASVVFEKLIDMGYRNAWFIIHRDSEYMDRIPDRVKDRLVYKYSFRHYLYFFACRTFIGTEALVHAIDLKTFNPFALKKTADKNLNYVFLQHGVMYMVSLDSESRKMFKPKQLNGLYRVVVSSHAEADHFTELGQHDPENLYICGLPKFDRSTLSPDADKIVIMPTWRPWEINDARRDFTSTAYYKMMERIYNAVPETLREKVIILPHPLIVNELHKISASLSSKIRLDVRYDDVLRQTAVLITDYSSIAYDAFYRGSRVIFCWEEKDACMAHYGPSTKLMLNEDNVFGDVFYNTDELGEAIRRNYTGSQYEPYRERYSRLVEFHDGHNTDRLIEFLKEDGILA